MSSSLPGLPAVVPKSLKDELGEFWPVLRIRDILLRIRIGGSIPLTTIPVPDPAIFLSVTFKAATKHYFCDNFFAYYFLKVHYICIIFQRYKVMKKSQNSRNQGFSFYFCLMVEGSGRPKNIRIRIRNTGFWPAVLTYLHRHRVCNTSTSSSNLVA